MPVPAGRGPPGPWWWGLPAGQESSVNSSPERGECLGVPAPQASKDQVLHATPSSPSAATAAPRRCCA